MPLLSFWKSNPSAIDELSIEQVVATAGDGALKDGSTCSEELREYLSQVRSDKLAFYVEQCLSGSFSKSGLVLQDLVNELARRLDYKVINGRYQGTSNAVGFDGVWLSPEGHAIIAEVKTTDAYRISLETIATYRQKILSAGQVNGTSSVLIVVGREDTGELEAQVRGSRHAWDIRLISADSLVRLVQLKENAGAAETDRKIRSLLAPMEYTRLDEMVDVMFTAAADVALVEEVDETEEVSHPTEVESSQKTKWQFTDSALLERKRDQIVAAISRTQDISFIKKSRALYWDANHERRMGCTLSKRYDRSWYRYWYAYHPQWDSFLADGTSSLLVLGCMDLEFAFAIPRSTIHPLLPALNTTTTERSTYWHLHIVEVEPEAYALLLPKESDHLPLTPFKVPL
jgi:hypothetical protein